MAASATSKVFMADQMISLLKEIDSDVQLIVRETRKQGPKKQREVRVLLQKYLVLLRNVHGKCRDLKKFAADSQTSLKGIEEILTLVLRGTVGDLLKEIHMEDLTKNFEDKYLRNASQLLKPNFDINQAGLELTDNAKKEIQDQVKDLRNEFSTIKERLEKVKEKASNCHKSSTEITQDFDAFIKEVEKTQNEMESKEGAGCFSASLMILTMAIALLAVGVAGLVACAYGRPILGTVVAVAGFGGGGLAGALGYDKHLDLQEKEIEEIRKALTDLQEELNQLCLGADIQKTTLKVGVHDPLKSIVDKINDLNADNLQLEPSGKGPMKRLLPGVQSVRTEVEDLNDNVTKFQMEAQRTLNSLQDLSLMSKSKDAVPEQDVTSAPPERKTKSWTDTILDFITGIREALQKLMNSEMGKKLVQHMAPLLGKQMGNMLSHFTVVSKTHSLSLSPIA